MIEQLLSLAGVLAGDEADLFENAQGSEGNVFEVADWSADQVKGSERLSAGGVRVWRIRHRGDSELVYRSLSPGFTGDTFSETDPGRSVTRTTPASRALGTPARVADGFDSVKRKPPAKKGKCSQQQGIEVCV